MIPTHNVVLIQEEKENYLTLCTKRLANEFNFTIDRHTRKGNFSKLVASVFIIELNFDEYEDIYSYIKTSKLFKQKVPMLVITPIDYYYHYNKGILKKNVFIIKNINFENKLRKFIENRLLQNSDKTNLNKHLLLGRVERISHLYHLLETNENYFKDDSVCLENNNLFAHSLSKLFNITTRNLRRDVLALEESTGLQIEASNHIGYHIPENTLSTDLLNMTRYNFSIKDHLTKKEIFNRKVYRIICAYLIMRYNVLEPLRFRLHFNISEKTFMRGLQLIGTTLLNTNNDEQKLIIHFSKTLGYTLNIDNYKTDDEEDEDDEYV